MASYGNNKDYMGNNLPYFDLGSDESGKEHTALQLALGNLHTCVLLNDGRVKCVGKIITDSLD